MRALTCPSTGGRLSFRFSLRSSASKRRSHKGVRFWFSSKAASGNNSNDDLATDAAAAAREVAEELQKTQQRVYVPKVEYGSPRCDMTERDAPWTSNEQVEEHYAALGWAVVPIRKDGNCLFRAISDQLYMNELFHEDIRRRLVDFIAREEQLFQPFIDDEKVSDYCSRLRVIGEWGGHLELYAAAKLFNIHIVVHTGPIRRLRVLNDGESASEKQNRPPPPYRTLHLLYKDDHYSSLHSHKQVKILISTEKTSHKNDELYKTVEFQEVVEDRPIPRDSKGLLYQEETLPECGVFLPKQVLFRHGKRRDSGSKLFSLVHVLSSSNLQLVETTSETSSTSSDVSTATSSSDERENQLATRRPILRTVVVEFPSKATFYKGRAMTRTISPSY